MDIVLNGRPHALPSPCHVETLLVHLDLGAQACAVEVNGELVPKAKHPSTSLQDGDVVEVVTLVGGG